MLNRRWIIAFRHNTINPDTPSRQADVPVDVLEHKTCFQVLVNLPGVQPQDIDITFQNSILQISGSLPRGYSESEATIHVKERYGGQFKRRIQLQLPIDIENISAEFQAGVLNLILPKTPDAIPRQIPVHGIEKPLVIESHTVEKSKNAK